jgi:hypothetical protein
VIAWRPTLEEQHCYADIEKSRFGAPNNDWIKTKIRELELEYINIDEVKTRS